jgi:hypothetical protein
MLGVVERGEFSLACIPLPLFHKIPCLCGILELGGPPVFVTWPVVSPLARSATIVVNGFSTTGTDTIQYGIGSFEGSFLATSKWQGYYIGAGIHNASSNIIQVPLFATKKLQIGTINNAGGAVFECWVSMLGYRE